MHQKTDCNWEQKHQNNGELRALDVPTIVLTEQTYIHWLTDLPCIMLGCTNTCLRFSQVLPEFSLKLGDNWFEWRKIVFHEKNLAYTTKMRILHTSARSMPTVRQYRQRPPKSNNFSAFPRLGCIRHGMGALKAEQKLGDVTS